jgi:hypothetical protein
MNKCSTTIAQLVEKIAVFKASLLLVLAVRWLEEIHKYLLYVTFNFLSNWGIQNASQALSRQMMWLYNN